MYFLDHSKHPRLLPKTLGKVYTTRCSCGAIVRTNGLLTEQFMCPGCRLRRLWVCDFCKHKGLITGSCTYLDTCTLPRLHNTLQIRTDVMPPVLELPTLEES